MRFAENFYFWMKMMKCRFIELILVISVLVIAVFGQNGNKSAAAFRFSPLDFKLVASGVVFNGVKCEFDSDVINAAEKFSNLIKEGDNLFYQPFGDYPYEGGLRWQEMNSKNCIRYSIGDLAESAGWFKQNDNTQILSEVRGLWKIGNKLWMGSQIGLIMYDTKSKRWSRFDFKNEIDLNRSISLRFADNDYLFISAYGNFTTIPVIIYSFKKNKWLQLKSIPRNAITEFGYTPERIRNSVSLTTDNRIYASKSFMPVKAISIPKVITENKGKTYIFQSFIGEESKTEFKLDKAKLDKFF